MTEKRFVKALITFSWLQPRELWLFICYVYRSFMQNRGLENAKSMTFTSLFAVVPLLTLTVAILSAFPSFQIFSTQIENEIFSRMLPSSSLQIQQYIESFSDQATHLTWAGAAMLMVTAYLMLVNIEKSFNDIWGIGEQRKGLSSFLLYWSVLSLSPLLLGMGFAVSSYITSLSLFQAFTEVTNYVGATHIGLTLFPILVTALAFTLLFVAVPNCGVHIRHGLAGGIVVALSFVIAKKAFTWFISKASYELVYGTFAALPVFLIWLYVCWVMILFGANLVRCLPLFHRERTTSSVHPTILTFALLHNFWNAHQQGTGIRIQDLLSAQWPLKNLKIDDYLEFLVENRFIRAVDQDEYLLVRDLKGIPVWQLLKNLPWAPITVREMEEPIPEVLKQHLPAFDVLKDQIEAEENCYQQTLGASLDAYFRTGALSKA